MRKTIPHKHVQNLRTTRSRSGSAAVAYPFSGIVGQAEIKLGLILNVIDPSIGGVLMMGHRGTGKSTAVRALADLLPEIWVTSGCLYNCNPNELKDCCDDCRAKQDADEKIARQRRPVPVVDLPLGATEDRVCGAIDIQRALTEGVKAFDPGLLARANRGFLYIDEVNLLDDHLVDLLLDVAITGSNKVERENISVEHPARFVLVGSGNPEEGELRPQLLDRFGLYVEVKTENDVEQRIEIVERREAFTRNPEAFCAGRETEQKQLRKKIARAGRNFVAVKFDRALLRQIATLCSELQVDGHRAELTIMRAARASAAFAGRGAASEEDVRQVASMALRHRLHRDALSEASVGAKIEQALDRVFSQRPIVRKEKGDGGGNTEGGGNGTPGRSPSARNKTHVDPGDGTDSENQAPAAAVDAQLPKLSREQYSQTKIVEKPSGRRAKGGRPSYNSKRGRYARSISYKRTGARIALDATLRALLAAGYQASVAAAEQHPPTNSHRTIPPATLRFKQFAQKQGTLFIFAIDTSGSMGLKRISEAKGALLNLLKESYIDRDSIAIVGFRGTSAEILLPASQSVTRAKHVLESLSVGGGTPLSAGLARSLEVARRAVNHQDGEVVLLIFTDGGANVPLRAQGTEDRAARRQLIEAEVKRLGSKMRQFGIDPVVVDTQNAFTENGNALALAESLGARYVRVEKPSVS